MRMWVHVGVSQVCGAQNKGLMLSGWEVVEQAFKEKKIYQLSPLKYKWHFSKQKEMGIVFQEGGGRQDLNEGQWYKRAWECLGTAS